MTGNFDDNVNIAITKDYDNSSGYGKTSEIPEGITNHFNWGAFTLNWIWGVGNDTYIALWIQAVGIFAGILAGVFFPIIILYLLFLLVFCIWLGINGNKFAWQNRKWKSINEFHRIQKNWAIVGLIILIFSIIITIPLLATPLLLTNSYASSTDSAGYRIYAKKAVSVLSQAMALNIAKDIPCPKTFTSESLAEYIAKGMRGNLSGKKIITSDGMYWQFDATGGDCSHNDCRVLIDTNGISKGPNKYWKTGGQPSDRIVIYIKRASEQELEALYPEFLENYSK